MKGSAASSIARSPRTSIAGRSLLILALVAHLSFLVSWGTGFWNRFTFDSTATNGRRGWDFYALYQAGHNVLSGISAYEGDGDQIDVAVPYYTPYRYLPLPAYTLGVALNALSPPSAFGLWVVVTELVLLGCAFMSFRLGGSERRGTVLAAMWLCFTPYYLEIYLGQFSLIQSALILLMMASIARHPAEPGPDWRFGLPWVMSLLWKQNTGLFAPLLVRLRRWRSLGWGFLAVVATSLPYFILYPSGLTAFLANFRSGPPTAQLGNLGVRQFLFSALSALIPSLSPGDHAMLQSIWVAATLAFALWLTLCEPHPDPLLLLCLWTTTSFLIYHHVWEHHYVMLLPVYVMLFRRSGSRAILILYALVAVWTCYVLVDPRGMAAIHAPMRWTPLEPRVLDVWYHACKAVPVLGLWAYIVRSIWRQRATREAETVCSPC